MASNKELVTVTIGGVSYEVSKAFAAALASGSESPSVPVCSEKGNGSEPLPTVIEPVVVESVGVKDTVEATGRVADVAVKDAEVVLNDPVTMLSGDVVEPVMFGNPEGVNAGGKKSIASDKSKEDADKDLVGFSLEDLNSAKVVELADLENPEQSVIADQSNVMDRADPVKVIASEVEADHPKSVNRRIAQFEDTVALFGGTMSEILASKVCGEPLANQEEALESLERLKDVARFDEMESSLKDSAGDNDEVQIIETSSSASKKKSSKAVTPRIMPLRSGKRKSAVKEELDVDIPKSSAKKPKIPKTIVIGREVLMELECTESFLKKEKLNEVLNLLKYQDWLNLCSSEGVVSHEVVNDFYKDLNLVEGPITRLDVNFRGKQFSVSSRDLSVILGTPHVGYDQHIKGNVWPEGVDSKRALINRLCGHDDVKGPIRTTSMEPEVKILHMLLTTNFIPRGTKNSYCQHE